MSPVALPLAERPLVRSAAVTLARVLMSEAGIKVKDLVREEAATAVPSSQAPRQLVTPTSAPQHARHGARRVQIYQVLEQAGEVGVSIQALMQLTGKSLRSMHSTMYYYESCGQVWRRRHHDVLHYVLSAVCAPIAGVAVEKGDLPPRQRKGPPKEAKPPKARRLAKPASPKQPPPAAASGQVQAPIEAPAPVVKVTATRLWRDAPVVIPEGVKVTRGPGLSHDPRYQVDTSTFTGGELLHEWQAKRQGGQA